MVSLMLRRMMSTTLLALALAACGDFISDPSDDPNRLRNASAAQLFTSVQVNTFFVNEGQLSRLSAIWLNQMAGTDRQFATLDTYVLDEEDADLEMAALYRGGGLRDIRLARAKADSSGFTRLGSILAVHEAFLFGMGASLWGALPYRQAGDPDRPAALDAQERIYADVQALLDEAAAGLAATAGAEERAILEARDMNFAGDADAWRAVAHTLKARFYLHWVEAQLAGLPAAAAACGGDCLARALAAAQQGIVSAEGDWNGIHSTASTETNLWYQLTRDRTGDVAAGELGVGFLRDRGDPRLAVFYTARGDGSYAGSRPGTSPGDPGAAASQLNTAAGGYARPDAPMPIATCAENRLILAEIHHRLGAEDAARAQLREGVRCHLQQLGLPSTDAAVDAVLPDPLPAGAALLEEIIRQKYLALFLNVEAFNDYKRTCLPGLEGVKEGTSVEGEPVPGRPYYGRTERQTNPNVPPPERQPARNANDPAPCP